MNLIYINEIGTDYKGQKQYEFIFSRSEELQVNDDWYVIPASVSSGSKSPDIEYVDMVGLLKNSNIELELIQNSDYFGIIDAVDGIVALGWEKFDMENEQRLKFFFREEFDVVINKLRERGLTLINEDII